MREYLAPVSTLQCVRQNFRHKDSTILYTMLILYEKQPISFTSFKNILMVFKGNNCKKGFSLYHADQLMLTMLFIGESDYHLGM